MSSIDFLTGIRGFAALCIFTSHILLPFHPHLYYAYGGLPKLGFLHLPLIRPFLGGGSPMVCIHFLISGITLSLQYTKLKTRNHQLSLYQQLESCAFRRPVRIYVPAIVSSLMMVVIAQLDGQEEVGGVRFRGDTEVYLDLWKIQPVVRASWFAQLSEWGKFFRQRLLLPHTWICEETERCNGSDGPLIYDYGFQLWTVPVEFWSSMILLMLLLGSARLAKNHTLLLFSSVVSLCLCVGRWDLGLFVTGAMISNMSSFAHMSRPEPIAERNGHTHSTFWAISLSLGLFLASFPEANSRVTPGFRHLSRINSDAKFWHAIGATLIVLGVSQLSVLRRLLSHPVLLHIGRISYALYLLQAVMLRSIGWKLVDRTIIFLTESISLDREVTFMVAMVPTVLMAVILAEFYHRLVVKQSLKLARQLERQMKQQ